MKRFLPARALSALLLTGVLVGASATAATADPIGDGETTPSHEGSLQIIPICEGPAAIDEWLDKNFADHAADTARYVEQNQDLIAKVAAGQADPWNLFTALTQIPIYSFHDAAFHLPASITHAVQTCDYLGQYTQR